MGQLWPRETTTTGPTGSTVLPLTSAEGKKVPLIFSADFEALKSLPSLQSPITTIHKRTSDISAHSGKVPWICLRG